MITRNVLLIALLTIYSATATAEQSQVNLKCQTTLNSFNEFEMPMDFVVTLAAYIDGSARIMAIMLNPDFLGGSDTLQIQHNDAKYSYSSDTDKYFITMELWRESLDFNFSVLHKDIGGAITLDGRCSILQKPKV
jgi:hypothetical protein